MVVQSKLFGFVNTYKILDDPILFYIVIIYKIWTHHNLGSIAFSFFKVVLKHSSLGFLLDTTVYCCAFYSKFNLKEYGLDSHL